MRAIVPSSFTISQSTPEGSSPASRARSTDASVCPLRCRTPPGLARSGKMCPGWTRSPGCDFGLARSRIVLARSSALMPVVMSCVASTETVKSVLKLSRLSRTMRFSPSLAARSLLIGAQIRPRPKRIMKLMLAAVAFSAARTRSPSFSRSASSTTITGLPARISRRTASMESMPLFFVAGFFFTDVFIRIP